MQITYFDIQTPHEHRRRARSGFPSVVLIIWTEAYLLYLFSCYHGITFLALWATASIIKSARDHCRIIAAGTNWPHS